MARKGGRRPPPSDDRRCLAIKADGSTRCGNWKAHDLDYCSMHSGLVLEAKAEKNAIRDAAARMEEQNRVNYLRDLAAIEERQKDILAPPVRTPEMVERRQVWVRQELGPNHQPSREGGWLQEAEGWYFRWRKESMDVLEQRDALVRETVDIAAAARRDEEIEEGARQAREDWKRRYPRWANARYWWGNTYWGGDVPPMPGHSATPPAVVDDPRVVKTYDRAPVPLADQTLWGLELGPRLG